ncbi:MAG: PAS domain-containing protein [candidate division Zixibacteria bacterium]|nr:PAS domain-containing protein [candidate division Zixibacteria bacterium]
MSFASWIREFPGAITICNADGIILEMNDKADETFKQDGGADLIGKNLLDCHPEPARSKLRDLMKSRKVNCYTIEKNGIRKMIYQSPWYNNGAYGGVVEFSIEIPTEMPHFVRQ